MKIRTDFVTNSSSSSFTLLIEFKLVEGGRVVFVGHGGTDELGRVDYFDGNAEVSVSPKALATADSVESLIAMLADGIRDEYSGPIFKKSKRAYRFIENIRDYIGSMDDISSVTIQGDEENYESYRRIYTYNRTTQSYTGVVQGDVMEINGGSGGDLLFDTSGCAIAHRYVSPISTRTGVFGGAKKKKSEPAKADAAAAYNPALSWMSGKIFVHTGLSEKTGREFEELVIANGGIVKSSTVLKTDYLVYDPDYDHETTKLKKAKELQKQGKPVVIISFEEWLQKISETAETYHGEERASEDGAIADVVKEGLAASAEKKDVSFKMKGDTLTQYTGTAELVEIPAGVTCIGANAFAECTAKTVVIPEGVTVIGRRAFAKTKSLEKIVLPESLREIKDMAFKESAIQELVLPENLEKIGDLAFSKCNGLKSVTLPGKMVEIGNSVFEGCESLVSATLKDGIIKTGDYLFSGCKSLRDVHLPGTLERIETASFSRCVSLASISLPESITEIGSEAFAKCESLAELHLPDGLKVIEDSAFEDCEALVELWVPGSLELLGYMCCEGCKSLVAVHVPDDFTEDMLFNLRDGDRESIELDLDDDVLVHMIYEEVR